MKKIITRGSLCVLLALVIAISFVPVSSFAASKPKEKAMKVYDVVKSDKYVYCTNGRAIYRYNIKTKKLKTIKKAVPIDEGIGSLNKHGKYIYYTRSDTECLILYRVKSSGGKSKRLISKYSYVEGYAIKKKQLYVTYSHQNGKLYKKVMKLNGQKKKMTKFKAKNIFKMSNKKGYKIRYQEEKCWLVLPDGNEVRLGDRY